MKVILISGKARHGKDTTQDSSEALLKRTAIPSWSLIMATW